MADTTLRSKARRARTGTTRLRRRHKTRTIARIGFAAHGAVYVLLGVLALVLAVTGRRQETDQKGALQDLTQHAGGWVLVLAIALGLSVYALWQLIRLVGADDARDRFDAGFSAVANAVLAATAFSVLFSGQQSSQANRQQAWTARVMGASGGRWLVGAVGMVVAVVGVVLAVRGLRRWFADDLDFAGVDRRVERTVLGLGVVGAVARGVVVTTAGVLVLVAAVQFEPKKARGFDEALRTLRDTPFGPWLLGLVAAGLLAFGLYGLAEARYHQT